MNFELDNNKSVWFEICLRKDLLLVFLCHFVFKTWSTTTIHDCFNGDVFGRAISVEF